MSHQRFPKVHPALFKNMIQKQQISYKMSNYKRRLHQVQHSKSKFTIDSINPNLTYRELFDQNPKRNQLLQTKYLQIQRENRLLFEKINKIHHKSKKEHKNKKQTKQHQNSYERINSLNKTIRQKQSQQISMANVKMFDRIQRQKPSISFAETDKQYIRRRKLSQKLSKIQKYRFQDWY